VATFLRFVWNPYLDRGLDSVLILKACLSTVYFPMDFADA